MNALHEAIAAHMAHPAGSCADPLSDSLAEQQACTQPAPLAPRLREGWEDEPIRVPHHWLVYLAMLLVGLLGFGTGGCATTAPREPSAAVWASCPPLPAPLLRTDNDAQTRRVAELEGWLGACAEAAPSAPACSAPAPTPPAHNSAAAQRLHITALEGRYSACRESALTPRAAP